MSKKVKSTISYVVGAIIFIGVMFVINFFLVSPGASETTYYYPTGSTYSDSADGMELLFRLFGEVGLEPVRHNNPLLEEFMPDGGVDVIWHTSGSMFKYVEVEDIELDWVDEYVYGGGRLVLISNPPPELSPTTVQSDLEYRDELLDYWMEKADIYPIFREVKSISEGAGYFSQTRRMPIVFQQEQGLGKVEEINTYVRHGIVEPVVYRFTSPTVSNTAARHFLRDSYGSVLVMYQHGDGQVWFVSDPYIFSNLMLREADNAVLAVDLVLGTKNWTGRSVLFDEYHLGFTRTRTFTDAARTPVGRAIMYLGFMMAIGIGCAGARFGPPRKSSVSIGVSQRAFVKALAGLWQGAGARAAAADSLWKRYHNKKDVRRNGLADELDRMRKGNPREDELIDISRKLD
ncbi:MAG: hypothetical protein NTY09_07055 [bacterium]|nr:hypothetical protein [bacterium]